MTKTGLLTPQSGREQNGQAGYVLGFDGGGTKSVAVVARDDGTVVGIGKSGTTNFQCVGVVEAGRQVELAIGAALKSAGIQPEQVSHAAYGVAGADRDADFDTVANYVLPANPAGELLIANDTTIALRAGTKDGVGVALICGTGSNCIGFDADRNQVKVGGLGNFTGDVGGGEDIVHKAIVLAMRGEDGRGPETILARELARALGVEQLVDVIAFFYPDHYNPPDLGKLVPIVFKCAAKGDPVAVALLTQIGDELGHNAVTACRQLFKKNDPITVVLGGSILQKARPRIFWDRIFAKLAKNFPKAEVVPLKDEPALGAVFFALDMRHGAPAGSVRMNRVRKSYRAVLAKLEGV